MTADEPGGDIADSGRDIGLDAPVEDGVPVRGVVKVLFLNGRCFSISKYHLGAFK